MPWYLRADLTAPQPACSAENVARDSSQVSPGCFHFHPHMDLLKKYQCWILDNGYWQRSFPPSLTIPTRYGFLLCITLKSSPKDWVSSPLTALQPTADVYLNPESCECHLLPIQLSLYLKKTQKLLSGRVYNTALQQNIKLKRLMNSPGKLFFHNTSLNCTSS